MVKLKVQSVLFETDVLRRVFRICERFFDLRAILAKTMSPKIPNKPSMRRIYGDPPLAEALVEVFFGLSKSDLTIWGSFYDKVKDIYPGKEQLNFLNVKGNLQSDGSVKPQVPFEPMIRFSKPDRSQLVQLTSNFITVNQLKPYCGYENFIDDTEKVLRTFIDVASPKSTTKIGLRYINRIVIPGVTFDLSEYFKFMPQIPVGIAQDIRGVLLQVLFNPKGSMHLITASLRSDIASEDLGSVFFLDIYDILEANNELNVDHILNTIDDAHANIENVFEGFITPKSRKLFQEVKENGR